MGRADLEIELSSSRMYELKKKKREHSDQTDHQNGNRSNDDHVTIDILKDIDLYLSAKNGVLDDFTRVLNQISAADNAPYDEILSRASPAGNTLLHVAAKHGNKDIVTHIASKSPYAIFDKNFNGDTALHLASIAEDDDVSNVRSLVLILEDLHQLPSGAGIVAARNNLITAKNERGNTALLEALNHGRESVAKYWIQEFPELAYVENKKGESALYLAAKGGFADCVSLIMQSCTNEPLINEQFKKMSPIKATIMTHNRDVMEAIFSSKPALINFRDGKGKTPLHYAVSSGRVKEVRFLLDNYSPCATRRDDTGLCPIHLASINGRVDIIRLLLRYCPVPGELLDAYGRNILHVAAVSGKYNVVKYILNNPDFEELINMKDDYGNTPLHLATMYWHPKIVSTLTWDKRVDVKLLNYMEMTALDVAEDNIVNYSDAPFRQRLTWTALKSAGTPRSPTARRRNETPQRVHIVDLRKERVNTLLVVSTLVATITFAAGFTMPGGYNSSATDLGMATLLTHRIFHLFVFCDTIAMHCSIVVVVALIFAQLGDLHLVFTALKVALPLLGVALSMMSMAFTAGISLVVGKLKWLRITVLVTGFTFLVILLFLFVPLCTYISSRNRILRYLSYYSFYFLMLATRSYD